MKQSKNEAQPSEIVDLVAQLNLLAEKIVTFDEGICDRSGRSAK